DSSCMASIRLESTASPPAPLDAPGVRRWSSLSRAMTPKPLASAPACDAIRATPSGRTCRWSKRLARQLKPAMARHPHWRSLANTLELVAFTFTEHSNNIPGLLLDDMHRLIR